MAQEPVLVILAAGMGSRYGGLKQIDPVGAYGEKIIDYSLYDAREAGFRRAIFIIKEELLPDFQKAVFDRAGKQIQIDYVFQKLEEIPAGFSVPEGRVKPWGTGHALLAAVDALGDAPYAVINADDFYGREAFEKIYRYLKNAQDGEVMDFSMVGYALGNTVTDYGSVSRGVCQTENGLLRGIQERLRIEKREGSIAYTEDDGKTWVSLPAETVVSMNFWGFTPGFNQVLRQDIERFFAESVPKNPLKAEWLLPYIVDDLLQQKRAKVTVLTSADQWFGVTYQEDKPHVMEGIRALTEQGRYPSPLWGD